MGTDVAATTTADHDRTIHIAIVDDQPIVVDGLLYVFSTLPGHHVVLTAYGGDDFLERLKAHPEVDVAIVDLQMPGTDGFAVLARLQQERPAIRAIAFSFNDDAEWIKRAIERGARAYVLKNTGRNELRAALRDVLDHGFHYPESVRKSLAQVTGPAQQTIDWRAVPPRELEYVRHLLAAKDPTYDQIAERMVVSTSAVHGYFRWFNKHYGTHSRAELVRLVMLSPPPPA